MAEPKTKAPFQTALGRRLWALREQAQSNSAERKLAGDTSDEVADAAEQVVELAGTVVQRADAMAAKLHEHKTSKDQAYLERNTLVALLARLYPSGVRVTSIEGWNPEWNGCVYIDLPTGQVSFHYHVNDAHLFEGLPPYTKPYDGHNKETAMKRLRDAFGYDQRTTANLIRN